MLGRLSGARERVEAVLARSGNTPAALSIAGGALDSIAHMEGLAASGRIGPSDLAALANALTAAQSTIAALEAASTASAARATEQLAAVSAEARATVRSVMAGMRDFDGELRFVPPDDRRAYDEREAERRAYSGQQPDTPAGNLNAAGAAVGQMADAHAHGAHGPAFDKRWNDLVATTERLRDAARANGVPTAEFDRRLREDLRAIMKAKGLSDAQIDARFAATPDPLGAARQFVKSDQDAAKVGRAAASASLADDVPVSASAIGHHDMSAVIAKLQSAGASPASPTDGQDAKHGVTAQGPATTGVGHAGRV